MPDYTDADVARLAEMMGYWHTGNLGMARHLLDQGVTLPPPPPDDTPPENDLVGSLQAECDRLAKERDAYRASLARAHAQVRDLDAYRASLAQAHRQVRDLRATLARRDQSLGDRVRSEFDAKWSWLLEAVGL